MLFPIVCRPAVVDDPRTDVSAVVGMRVRGLGQHRKVGAFPGRDTLAELFLEIGVVVVRLSAAPRGGFGEQCSRAFFV